jgi:multiple sugar transport system substrate-binding protein
MSTSKHKEDAYRFIEFMLSDEMQTLAVKGNKMTVLKDPQIRKQFGQDYPQLKGKHTAAMDVNSPVKAAPPRDPKLVTVSYLNIVLDTFKNISIGKNDINTELRNVDELLNKEISEEMAK